MDNQGLLTAVVVVLVILLILWAYDKCHLDQWLPSAYKKCGAMAGFVGAMGGHRAMVPCAYPSSANGQWQFNRCNYA